MQSRDLISTVFQVVPVLAVVVSLQAEGIRQEQAPVEVPTPHMAQETLPPYSGFGLGGRTRLHVPCLSPPC